jgi:hypothetical protein
LQEQIGDKYLPKMKFSWKRFGYVEPTRWHRYNTWKPPAVISSKMRIIDVTGDGLPDILQCASSSVTDCKSWINTSSCHCVANLSQCLSKLYTVLLRHIVNNQPNHCPDCKSWINTGTGWKRDDAYKPQTAIAGNYSGVVKDYGVRIVDVNGDGLVDYLQCDTAGACKAWINTGSGWQRNLQSVTEPDDNSHCKKSGRPSPVTSTIRTPLSILLVPLI